MPTEEKVKVQENLNSFGKGWSQVKQCDVKKVKKRLMTVLHLEHRSSFYVRLKGSTILKDSQRAAIESIFHKYGITDIWGTV